MLNEFQYCEQKGIPLAVIIGQSEIESGVVKLKTIGSREEVSLRFQYYVNGILVF